MYKKYFLSIATILVCYFSDAQIITDFNVKDTLCLRNNISTENISTFNNSYLWSFCEKPLEFNIIKSYDLKSNNLFTSCFQIKNNFFMLGNKPTEIIRFGIDKFNNNLIIIDTIGKLNNIPDFGNGLWIGESKFELYGFVTVGYNTPNRGLYRLRYGSYFNKTPIVDSLGDFADFKSPTDIQIANDNKEWIGFVTNPESNTISRFSFGNDLSNKPINLPLPSISLLNKPSKLLIRYEEQLGWLVIVKNLEEQSLCILKFGNSLKNEPKAYNLLLDIDFNFMAMNILKNCDGNQLYIIANSDGLKQESGNIYKFSIDEKFEKITKKIFVEKFKNIKNSQALSFDLIDTTVTGFTIDLNEDAFKILEFKSCDGSSKEVIQEKNINIYVDKVKDYYINLLNNPGQYNQGIKCKKIHINEDFKKPNIVGKKNYCLGENIYLSIDDTLKNVRWMKNGNLLSENYFLKINNAQQENGGSYSCDIYSKTECGSYTIDFDITVSKKVTIEKDTSICFGKIFKTYQGKTIESGVVSDTFGVSPCDSIVNYHVEQYQLFDIDLGNDLNLKYGQEIDLNLNFNFPLQYIDSIYVTENNITKKYNKTLNIPYTPKSNTSLFFLARLYSGCTALDTLNISIINEKNVYIPNVFNPSGEGTSTILNRRLFVFANSQYVNLIKYFAVYDQLGRRVFEEKNMFPNDGLGWDGKYKNEPLMPGIYMWYVEIEYLDGQIEKRSGDVALIYK